MMERTEIEKLRDRIAPAHDNWSEKLRDKKGEFSAFEAGILAQAMRTNLLLCEILVRMEEKTK